MNTRQSPPPSHSKSEKRSVVGRKWTPEEDQYLRDQLGKLHPAQIGEALGRSKNAVWHRAAVLGCVFRDATDDETAGMDKDRAKGYRACKQHLADLIRVYGEPPAPQPASEVTRHTIPSSADAPITSFASLCVEE